MHLQHYLPSPIAKITAQYANFKWCIVDGLHADSGRYSGRRGCCCVKCKICGRATRTPSKRGMRMYIGAEDSRLDLCWGLSKWWICGLDCFTRLTLDGVDVVYVMHDARSKMHSVCNYLCDQNPSSIALRVRSPKYIRKTARHIYGLYKNTNWYLESKPDSRCPSTFHPLTPLPLRALERGEKLKWGEMEGHYTLITMHALETKQ